jgi:16S rRNA processing protein RimM
VPARTRGSTSSTERGGPAPAERVALGRVTGPHGVAGLVRVRWLGDDGATLRRLERIRLARHADGEDASEAAVESVADGRPGELRMRLAGVTTREQAEALHGRWVFGSAGDLAPLPKGEHYWFELIGCDVETTDGRTIGRVVEIWDPGAHDVLVIESDEGRRHLVPAVDAFVREVDVAARRLRIETIPGLLGD